MAEANPDIRFLRFECDQYYPGGWSSDLTGLFATLDEALREPTRYDYGDVYDTWTGESHEIPRHRHQPERGPQDDVSAFVLETLLAHGATRAFEVADAVRGYVEFPRFFTKGNQ